MSKTAIVTDSNSGITQEQSKQYGVTVIPMPFTIDGETFYEDINLSQDEFYSILKSDVSIFTSQPSAGTLTDTWNGLLKEYDEVVHIPMSSSLSASCQTAMFMSEDYEGKVQVVNNQRISVTLKQSVLDAKTLADRGVGAAAIKEYLEEVKHESGIYIMVDTLKYLKKGGRVTPAGAALGTALNIKPVLQIHGERLDSYAKARGVKNAREIMIKAIRKDLETRYPGCADPEHMWLQMAYTYNRDAAEDFKKEVEQVFPGYEIVMDPLALSVSCHIGPGALAVAYTKKLDYNG